MTHDPFDIRSQEQAQADRAERAKLKEQTDSDDFVWLMQSKRGRRIVWRLLELAGVFQLSFDKNAMQMAFAEGRRSFGNQIFAQVHELAPEQYVAMVTEQKSNDDRNLDR